MTGFPGLGLLRVLRPTPAASAGDGPSRRPAGCWPGRGPPGWFPRSLSNRSTGSAPSYAPAASPRLRRRPSPWPPGRRHHTGRGVPRTPAVRVRAATQPRSARFELVGLLRGVQPLVPHVHLSVLLAGPGPSGSAGPSRRCQGCCPPSPSSPGSGCPQLQPARCDGPAAVSFHHRTVQERLVALDVGDPQLVRRRRAGTRRSTRSAGRSAAARRAWWSARRLAAADAAQAAARASAARRCSGPPGCLPGAAAARPCGRRRRRSCSACTRRDLRPSARSSRDRPGRGRPARWRRSRSTGRSAARGRSARPRTGPGGRR